MKNIHLIPFLMTIGLISTLASAGTNKKISQAFPLVPLLEMQGHACFGYLTVTSKYVDFYTPSFDCHRMSYSNFNVSDDPILLEDKSYHSVSMTIDHPTNTCPFAAVEVLTPVDPNVSRSREVIGYPTLDTYQNQRWGINQSTGNDDVTADFLLCGAYKVDSKQLLQIKPESRRVKPQVSKK